MSGPRVIPGEERRYPLGPCVRCGAWGPDVELIRAVPTGTGREETVFACPEHVHPYVSRTRDLDWLARRRGAVTGESVAEARAALLGSSRGAGQDEGEGAGPG